ncbi:MAG: reverse transcriptase family protein, partial [Janthinobacterium lividum]
MQSHEVYNARLFKSFFTFTVFFDYGCGSCYVSESLAKKLEPYRSQRPTVLTGVGGDSGPSITKDVLVTACFKAKDGWSVPFSISAGVVTDGTFPGDMVLGRSVFHNFSINFLSTGGLELHGFPGRPVLFPATPKSPSYWVETAFLGTEELRGKLNSVATEFIPIIEEWNKKFPGVFDHSLRRTSDKATVMHRIDTGDAEPIKQPPRRYSPSQEAVMRAFIKSNEGKVIVKSKSPWATPALLIPKRSVDGSPKKVFNNETGEWEPVWRFCCDYRRLNSVTKKHAQPLPNADYEIERAAGHKFYVFLDLLDGFWHIGVHPLDREKTAIVTPFGIYEWLVMPFGLTNAPATFQAFMEEVLEPFRDFVAGLLDDIAIWADTIEELISRVHKTLQRLQAYGLVLNIGKCRWFVKEGTFLG